MADKMIYPPMIGSSHAKTVKEMAMLCMGGF